MSFTTFTQLFPEAQLPLHLGEDSYRTFEATGKLVPDELAAEYIAPLEPELDEFTELLTVGRFAHAGYVAVVYWKAGLLHNHYRLVTFDAQGNVVDQRVLAGSYVEAGSVSHSAATVTESLQIYVVSAVDRLGAPLGSAEESSALILGIDDSGLIREVAQEREEN